MKTKTISCLNAVIFALCFLWMGTGCDQIPYPEAGGMGTLVMNITDAPDEMVRTTPKKDKDEEEQYEQVYVTFTEISVHKADVDNETDDELDDRDNETDNDTETTLALMTAEDNETDIDGEWIVVSSEEQGFDLLQFQNGEFDLLAQADLEAGKYTQIRLKITDEEDENGEPKTYVMVEGEKYKLTVPSGTRSGLKLTEGINVYADQETVIFIDFDAEKSVHKTGNGKYQMKPTIKILDSAPLCTGGCDNETDNGTEIPDNESMYK